MPCASMCVRKSWVYGPLSFEEKTSHLPLGDQLCHEFMRAVLHCKRRASPPAAGMMKSWLSGWRSMKLLALQNTIHWPSGEYLAK